MKYISQDNVQYVNAEHEVFRRGIAVAALPSLPDEPLELRAVRHALNEVERYQNDARLPLAEFPLQERERRFREIVTLYNLLVESLVDHDITLDANELTDKDVACIRAMLQAFIAAYQLILPGLQEELARSDENVSFSQDRTEEMNLMERAAGIGKLLGLYVALLDAPAEFKKSTLGIVAEMSIEQQLKLLELFEEAFILDRLKPITKAMQKMFAQRMRSYEDQRKSIVQMLIAATKQNVDTTSMKILKAKVSVS